MSSLYLINLNFTIGSFIYGPVPLALAGLIFCFRIHALQLLQSSHICSECLTRLCFYENYMVVNVFERLAECNCNWVVSKICCANNYLHQVVFY